MPASTDTENTDENEKDLHADSLPNGVCSSRIMQQMSVPQGAIHEKSKIPDVESASVSEMNTDERDFRKKQVNTFMLPSYLAAASYWSHSHRSLKAGRLHGNLPAQDSSMPNSADTCVTKACLPVPWGDLRGHRHQSPVRLLFNLHQRTEQGGHSGCRVPRHLGSDNHGDPQIRLHCFIRR